MRFVVRQAALLVHWYVAHAFHGRVQTCSVLDHYFMLSRSLQETTAPPYCAAFAGGIRLVLTGYLYRLTYSTKRRSSSGSKPRASSRARKALRRGVSWESSTSWRHSVSAPSCVPKSSACQHPENISQALAWSRKWRGMTAAGQLCANGAG